MAGFGLVGCGDDDDDDDGQSSSSPTAAATGTASGPIRGGTLTLGGNPDNGVFDPAVATPGATSMSIWTAYDRLNYIGTDFKLTEGMAALPETPDPLTWIYRIKDNVFWHDKAPLNGRQFTAEDAAFGLQRMGTDDPRFLNRGVFAGAKIEATDKLTLKITLSEPFAPLSVVIADDTAAMVSKEIAAADFSKDASKAIGTGPFMFSSRVQDNETVMVRNPKYYRPNEPYFDQLRVLWLADAALRVAAFVSKQTDFLNYPFSGLMSESEKVQAQASGLKVFSNPQTSSRGIIFNVNLKPFDNPMVRTALHVAVNRAQLNAAATGATYVAGGPLSKSLVPYGFSDEKLSTTPGFRSGSNRDQDVKDAKAMLAAANADTSTARKITCLAGDLSAQVLQQNWKDIGFSAVVDERPGADVVAARAGRNFDIVHYGQIGGSDPDLLYAHVHSKGGQNFGNFTNPDIDALLVKGRRTMNTQERKSIYDDIQTRLLTNLNPRVWTGNVSASITMRPDIKGFSLLPGISAYSHVFAQMWRDNA
jgi:peptide/nickel transport system substrate-binding protein